MKILPFSLNGWTLTESLERFLSFSTLKQEILFQENQAHNEMNENLSCCGTNTTKKCWTSSRLQRCVEVPETPQKPVWVNIIVADSFSFLHSTEMNIENSIVEKENSSFPFDLDQVRCLCRRWSRLIWSLKTQNSNVNLIQFLSHPFSRDLTHLSRMFYAAQCWHTQHHRTSEDERKKREPRRFRRELDTPSDHAADLDCVIS